ncbi:MAG: cytochrome P450 [Actinomycetota bacterium]|nr:cytochrome P450 [Actinomycetota bacterium]
MFHSEGVCRVLAVEAQRYGTDTPAFGKVAAMIGGGLLASRGERWQRHWRRAWSGCTLGVRTAVWLRDPIGLVVRAR